MSLSSFIQRMPKVELHVHLEGAIQPETLIQLAKNNHIVLPASDVVGLRQWYQFVDFPHFVRIYTKISRCICTADDIELIAREFLVGQAKQNIRYTEVTYTAYTLYLQNRILFDGQMNALRRAIAWAERELGVSMGVIIDIPREIDPKQGIMIAEWVKSTYGDPVIAMGLGGYEVGNPPEKFAEAFDITAKAGIPSIIHAGENDGPTSIWGALNTLQAIRIGHGIHCLDDANLVNELRQRQTPLEVCPSSNVCLGEVKSIQTHPINEMIQQDLYVTVNSDDPPMFNTTLTNEYEQCVSAFQWDERQLEQLVMNAVRATLLPATIKTQMEASFRQEFAQLRGYSSV